MIFGSMNTGTTVNPWDSALGALPPEDAYNIDTKADDGLPALGNIVGAESTALNAPNCSTTTEPDSQYDVSRTSGGCFIVFMQKPAN
jgi:hypothetical protein